MNRKKFLERIALLSGAGFITAVLPSCSSGAQLLGDNLLVKGNVQSANKGLSKVIVSDGYTVTATDATGKFSLNMHPDARSIFVSTPAGYAFAAEKGIAKHYFSYTELGAGKNIVFELEKLLVDDSNHQFIIWADPQVKHAGDVEKMMTESVPDVQKFLSQTNNALMHGITVGDIVWDNHALFQDYNVAVQKMGIPFFQCLGNHDMDYNMGGDETSDVTFQKTYGPTYYSFNRGQVHYVVMDNVRYLGKDQNYDGFVQQHQLDWLRKDLSFVDTNKLIVLCLHIPVHAGTKNKEELYAVLGPRKTHIMSGHTHYNVNDIHNNIYEHNHGAVCGAWWTGPICEDGTPCGYGVYTAYGNELSWQYKGIGKENEEQMALHISDYSTTEKLVIANVWNADPTWKTECWADGKKIGTLQQYEGYDPAAYASLLGPKLPETRSWAEPKLTAHLYKIAIPITTKNVKVIATDRFGKSFTATQFI